MDKFWTIAIWILVFVVVTGTTHMAIEALVPSEWVKRLSIFALVLGWWVAEQVRKKRKSDAFSERSKLANAVRWVVAVPLGFAAAVTINFVLVFAFSIAHGFDAVSSFFDSLDMNGMPIAGSYILFGTRAFTAAVLVFVIAYVVPAFHTRVAIASGCVVGILSFGLFGYVVWMAIATDMALTMSMWYRAILELVSLLAGSAIGAGIGSDPRENRVIG